MAENRENLKEEIARKPGSVVILPRTNEGRVMAVMAWRLARILNTARRRAQIFIPFEEVMEVFNRVKELVEKMEGLVVERAPGLYTQMMEFSGPVKIQMAKDPRSWVFDPDRTPEEVLKLAGLVAAVDSMCLEARARIDREPLRAKEIIEKAMEMVVEMEEVCDFVSRKVLGEGFALSGRNGRIIKAIKKNLGMDVGGNDEGDIPVDAASAATLTES